MKKTTKLMSKLFSDSTPNQFKEDVMDKIEEAKKYGTSEYSDETSDLKMESDGEEVKITDAKNGDEVTVATENPDVEGDVQLKAESDTAPDVQTPVTKGIDGEHIENSVPDVEVKVDMGITDEGKAGLKAYSIKFFGNKSFSDTLKTARAIAKAFSECPVAATKESLEKSANAALGNAETSEEEKEFAEQVDQIAQNATELAKAADDMEETQDPELAKTVKEMSEDLEEQCNDLKSENPDNCDFSNIIAQCKKFSDAANEIVAKTDAATEKPTEDSETKAKAEELRDKAQKVQDKSANLKDDDKKGAEKLKEMCNDLMSDIEDAEDAHDNLDTEELKDKVASYSEQADEVINNAETKEAAENVADKAKEIQEKAESLSDDDVDGAEELKEMCNDLKSDIEDAEDNHDNIQVDDEVKEKIESYSAKADEVINNDETKEVVEDVADKAKKVQEKAESLSDDDVEGAEKLKEMCNDLMSDIEDAEENHDNIQVDDEVKEKIESYSAKADEVINSQVRSFSQSSYMSNGNFIPTPKVKTTGTQRTFSNVNDTKKVLNPYLYSKF